MKYFMAIVIILLSPTAFSGGVEGGGGGSRLASAFRLTAFELIHRIAKVPEAEALCASTQMEDGLNHSKIQVVDTLVDLNTGLPVEDQHLDAWTKPGYIQLRLGAWWRYLSIDYRLDPGVNALVLHEVYRTTTTCNDDNGQLSSKVIQLFSQPTTSHSGTKYSKLFSFKYPVDIKVMSYKNPDDSYQTFAVGALACEEPFDIEKPTAGIKCAFFGQDPSSVISIVVTTSKPSWPMNTLIRVIVLARPGGQWFKFANAVRVASKDQPLHMLFDAQTGQLAYGFDRAHLNVVVPD